MYIGLRMKLLIVLRNLANLPLCTLVGLSSSQAASMSDFCVFCQWDEGGCRDVRTLCSDEGDSSRCQSPLLLYHFIALALIHSSRSPFASWNCDRSFRI